MGRDGSGYPIEELGKEKQVDLHGDREWLLLFISFFIGVVLALILDAAIVKSDQKATDEQVKNCIEQIELEGKCSIKDSQGNSITATEWSNWAENKVSK